MVRRVTAKVDVDAAGARAGAQDTEQSAGRIAGAFEGLKGKAAGFRDAVGGLGDKVSGLAREHLGPFGDAADKLGVDLENVSGALPVVGAAVAGVTAFIAGGVAKWQELTAEVKAYTAAAGLGAEEASRFNAVFKQFGVEAEDGVDVLKTLAEEAGDAPEKFAQYGVEIAKATDGTVDMAATLGNVADRFQAMRDPTERAAMGAALFGDAWVKIAPILERGGDELDQLLAGVKGSALVTDEGIRQAEDYQRSMAELSQQFESLQIAAAKQAIPALVDGMKDLAGALEALNGIEERFGAISAAMDGMSLAFNPLKAGWDRLHEGGAAWGEYFDTIENGRTRLENVTGAALSAARAQQDQAAAAEQQADKQRIANEEAREAAQRQKDLEKALDDATAAYQRSQQAITDSFNAELAYERQTTTTKDAVDRLTEASDALTTATETVGLESDDGRAAQGDYAAALDAAKGSVLGQAEAAVTLAGKQAEVHGTTLGAAEANTIYRSELEKARDATGDPNLAAYLDGLIGRMGSVEGAAWGASGALREVAAAARDAAIEAGATEIAGMGIVTPADRIAGARAGGGPVNAGSRYLVGERGPEILELGASGYVTPLDRIEQQAAGAGQPLVVQLVVDGRTLTEQTIPYHELDRRSRQ